MGAEKKHTEFALGERLLYRRERFVTVFGRERDTDGMVEYYWVVDGAKMRFKAWPQQLERAPDKK